jgi:hypothetical protein
MKQEKYTGSKTAHRIFTLAIPADVWQVAEEESRRDNNRPLGPTLVKMLQRAIARRKAVAQ